MKKGNIIYYALGAAALWYLYKKYYKQTPTADTAIILNQSKLLSAAEQVAAPVSEAAAASYNVKYSISGVKKFNLPQTL